MPFVSVAGKRFLETIVFLLDVESQCPFFFLPFPFAFIMRNAVVGVLLCSVNPAHPTGRKARKVESGGIKPKINQPGEGRPFSGPDTKTNRL